MNNLEQFIYNIVKKVPFIKNSIVSIYQLLLLPFGSKGFKTLNEFTILENQYFGFHDKSPFNIDDSIILGFRPPEIYKNIKAIKSGDILINYGKRWSELKVIDSTLVWNNVMGPMLHWYDINNNILIYNSTNKNSLIAKLYDVNNNSFFELNEPCVHSNSKKGLFCSYNLSDAEKGMKGYGIPDKLNFVQNYKFIVFNKENNVLVKLDNNDLKSLIDENSSFIWVHHCLFSPNGENIFFMIRWYNKLGERISKLFIFNTSKSIITDTKISGMISHLTWVNDEEIIVYMNPEFKYGDAFYIYKLIDKSFIKINNSYLSDGHPTSLDLNNFIFDTYPNKFREQFLYFFSINKQQKSLVATNNLPFRSKGAYQYDLHPRLSRNKRYISIDCLNNNKLNQIIIDVKS